MIWLKSRSLSGKNLLNQLLINRIKNMIQDINNKKDDVLNVNDYDDFCENKNKVYKKFRPI